MRNLPYRHEVGSSVLSFYRGDAAAVMNGSDDNRHRRADSRPEQRSLRFEQAITTQTTVAPAATSPFTGVSAEL